VRRLERQNRYILTPDGIRVALFYTELRDRLLRPLLAADQPPAPVELRQALRVVDRPVGDYVINSRIAAWATLPQCFRSRSPRSPGAGSRRIRPFHARGSAAHPGSAWWHPPPPRRPADRTPVR